MLMATEGFRQAAERNRKTENERERGRRMPTGHPSFYAYVCIYMHTHATPAGYKHLPIMLTYASRSSSTCERPFKF